MPEEKPESNIPNQGSGQSRDQERDLREQRREWRERRHEERHRDPLRGLFWGLLLVLIGLIFLANQQGWISEDRWWQFLLIGLGAIFIINGLAHYWNPAYRHFSFGQFIPGIVLLLVGIAFIFNFSEWWPLILIGVGVVILLTFVFRRR
jgi:hypothetical protein